MPSIQADVGGVLHFDPQRNYSGISFLKLPLGLHLGFKPWKEPASTAKDEVKALELVRRYTSIPVSRHRDAIPSPGADRSHDDGKNGFLACSCSFELIKRLQGYQLRKCIDFMSGRHLRELALQLREYISQLRSIPRTDEAVNLATQEKHKTVFTHRILREANILVDRRLREDGTTARWLVTGIAGWTAAGWHLEHFEFVSGMFEGSGLFRMLLRQACGEGIGNYEADLEAEERIWAERKRKTGELDAAWEDGSGRVLSIGGAGVREAGAVV
ncbi:hypothetical protein NKR19_g9216 [Coniochaeta hoffmannii]|uniref:Aminoglycoside phosphotransferase domain-containing protein n=1 Tax=Coniochaeta hoffmannii TaxID=91930 RepID=A0AA38VKK9_9PEZI|nr:hypothetical protein NKR19_g9216 [Coniochaeta hoffmannii]